MAERGLMPAAAAELPSEEPPLENEDLPREGWPPLPPPLPKQLHLQPQPLLQVRLNPVESLGFCVYALRSFARGERIIRERTALEATHDIDPRGIRNVYERYGRLSPERRCGLHGAFPMLAWANGIDAYEAAEARHLIGSRILGSGSNSNSNSSGGGGRGGSLVDIALTAQDHIKMRPDGAAIVAAAAASSRAPGDASQQQTPTGSPLWSPSAAKTRWAFWDLRRARTAATAGQQTAMATTAKTPDPDRARRETLQWFSRYAFRLKPASAFGGAAAPGGGSGHHQAAVYLLTDLLNHRCAGFQNCRVAVDIGTVAIVALRDIAAGEELTINYSKSKKDFDCRGECCSRK